MQQTRLDRWLKEKFVMETHVLSLSAPPWIPPGTKLESLEVGIKNRFRYKMVIRKRSDLEKALQSLSDANQTFVTRIESRKVWCRSLFDDPLGRSFTFRVLGLVFLAAIVATLVYYVPWDQAYRLREAFDFLRPYM